MPKVAIVELEGVSPISFSKKVSVPEKEGENPSDYDSRTWRERLHVNNEGFVIIPPMMFKNSLSAAGKYLSERIAGKGQKTWTKIFEAGVMVLDPIVLPIKKEDVIGEDLFVPSDGTRGGSKRVTKTFPKIDNWKGKIKFHIMDDSLSSSNGEIFLRHLTVAGNFIGIGRFRPAKNGYYGRFKVNSVEWVEE